MARQMVLSRKGGGLPTVPTDAKGTPIGDPSKDSSPDNAPLNEGTADDDGDIVQCPNCHCQFNENDPKDIVKAGLPVVKTPPEPRGAELDPSPPPVPGRLGAAHDAAYGFGVEGNLLDSIKQKLGR